MADAMNSTNEEPSSKKIKLTDSSENEEPLESVEVKSELEVHESVEVRKQEIDVGITEYISTSPGFSAIIKQRYSDFLVNEVGLNGEIVQLTDIDTPTIDDDTDVNPSPSLLEVVTEEQINKLRDIEKSQQGEVWIQVGDDKEKRTNLHSAIRENFDNLESSTTDKDGEKYIKVCSGNIRHNFNKHNKERHKRKPGWRKGTPNYCQFVLYKENTDTPNAVNQLAKVLRMNAGQFTYAGTKDKRAKSSQLITVYRVTATRLHHLNKRFKYFALGNFKYVNNPLKLGMLKGNHFTVVLRSVNGSDDQINHNIQTLKSIGFINYFGMQRFGTAVVPTHHIGRAVLQNKWMDVVDLIMQPRNDGISNARKVWKETKDAKAALDVLGHHPCIEKHLLMGLAKSADKDIVGALSYIPRNSRHMYLHSYQSFVWNTVASLRIQKYGFKPVVGDLILPTHDTIDVNEDEIEESQRTKPEAINESTINNYTIQDIVLPLPGFDVILPSNDIAKEYQNILEKDQLDMNSFKHKVRDYAMPGGYRYILCKPTNVNHNIMYYNDHTESLILSDYDKLKGTSLSDKLADGALKAVKLEITLPRSTYATMAIREVIKCDTSAAEQTKLSLK